MTTAYIVDAVRLPRAAIAKTGGAYAANKPVELLASLLRALPARNDFDPALVDDILLGCSTQSGSQGANVARIASLYADWPDSVAAGTISRFCCSGLDACNLAAAKLQAGSEQIAVAGGIEHLSSAPIFSDRGAWFSDPEVMSKTRFMPMGLAADLLACQHSYSREQLDALSLESQRRAALASEEGRFAASLVPLHADYLADGQVPLLQDDAIRANAKPEQLARLAASFAEHIDNYRAQVSAQFPELHFEARHSAANSPALVDGASLLLMASEAACREHNLQPRAKLTSFANAGDDPLTMLTGHIAATEKLLARQGLSADDIDLWEVNESFAATVLLYQQRFGIDSECLNVNGSAIAMGHPLGATGGNLLSILLDELERSGKQRGIAAICGGAGVGVATMIERV